MRPQLFASYPRSFLRSLSINPGYHRRRRVLVQASAYHGDRTAKKGSLLSSLQLQNMSTSTLNDPAKIVKSSWGPIEIPENTTYLNILLETFHKEPRAIAMINGVTGEKYSFSRLTDHVQRLANGLREQGVEKGDVVCFCLPNCVEYALLIFATHMLGAVVNLVNPQLVSGDITKLVRVSSPDYLVTRSDVFEKFSTVDHEFKKVFSVDTAKDCIPFRELLSENGNAVPESDFDMDAPAFIPYSSGTTGLPKGVVLSHRNMLWAMLALGNPPNAFFKPGDVTNLVFPLAHIAGINLLLHALYINAATVFFPGFDFEQFLAAIPTYKITAGAVPPPVNIRLFNDPLVDEYDLTSLRILGCGAAAIRANIQIGVRDRLKLKYLKQAYGMTEVSGITHVDDEQNIENGSAGKVIPNMEVKIVDPESGDTLDPTSEGEVWMRGPGIMKGYLNQPGETKKVITEDGWMKTGDIGYHSEDGHIYIVDRNKDLIKYKGLQVSPAELEAVLLTHPDIADVAVVEKPDDIAGEVPKAFVTLKPGVAQANMEENIKDFMKERVSPFKQLRGGVRFIDVIPKLSSGKILRRLLRDMD